MSTGWNPMCVRVCLRVIINLLGNEYWLEQKYREHDFVENYKPTGK